MNIINKAFLILLVSIFSLTVNASVVVVVNPGNASSIDEKAIKKIFLGKQKSYPDGSSVTTFIQGGPSSDIFYSDIVSKNKSRFKAYWAKRSFSGKGTPPREVSGDAEMKESVANDVSAIGFIDSTMVDDSVKVILTK